MNGHTKKISRPLATDTNINEHIKNMSFFQKLVLLSRTQLCSPTKNIRGRSNYPRLYKGFCPKPLLIQYSRSAQDSHISTVFQKPTRRRWPCVQYCQPRELAKWLDEKRKPLFVNNHTIKGIFLFSDDIHKMEINDQRHFGVL